MRRKNDLNFGQGGKPGKRERRGKEGPALEGTDLKAVDHLLLARSLFRFKFQALHSGSQENHLRGHLPGFKTQGMATAGKILIPGDEKVPALKTIDLLGVHGFVNRMVQRA
jgi:hypothetical protein